MVSQQWWHLKWTLDFIPNKRKTTSETQSVTGCRLLRWSQLTGRSLRPARQSASNVGRPLVCVGIIHREETKTGSAKKMSSSLLTQDVLLFAFAVSIFGKLKPSDSCFSFNHEQSIFDCSWVTHWTYIYLHSFQHNISRAGHACYRK